MSGQQEEEEEERKKPITATTIKFFKTFSLGPFLWTGKQGQTFFRNGRPEVNKYVVMTYL